MGFGQSALMLLFAALVGAAWLSYWGPTTGHDVDRFAVVRTLPHAAEQVLRKHAAALGNDEVAYRGHLLRVASFYRALEELDGVPEEDRLADDFFGVVLATHDLDLFHTGNWDYIGGSIEWMRKEMEGRPQHEVQLGAAMVEWHHKLTAHSGGADAVERFRKADTIDVK